MLKNFTDLISLSENNNKISRLGVVSASDEQAIRAILDPLLRNVIVPVLIGDSIDIMKILSSIELPSDNVEIVHVDTIEEASLKSVEMVKNMELDILMKGKISSRDFLKPIVKNKNNLVQGNLLNHIALFEVPNYSKLLITSDGGMIPEPTLEEKRVIIKNTIQVSKKIGYKTPKIAILGASELVNPRINSSKEAEMLMNEFEESGEDCFIDGPLSLDLALSKEIAQQKKYESDVAGDADILIAPDMTAMNLLGKSFSVVAQGKMAGIIYGAKIPIIMTSRGSSYDEKIYSIILARIISEGETSR